MTVTAEELSAEECIASLVQLTDKYPGRRITRRLFRQQSTLPEATWLQHWPSFTEFRQAAGLQDHTERSTRYITDNSKDWLAGINERKASWAGHYRRDSGRRFRTVLVGSDFHDLQCDPFVAAMFTEAARRAQPDAIVLAGDWLDLPEMGRFNHSTLGNNDSIVDRFDWLHSRLEELRDMVPDAEIHFLEGNHEFRMIQHLANSSDALKSVLADIHGFDLPGLFGLHDYQVNYHSQADLLTFGKGEHATQIKDTFLVLWDAVLVHHFPEGSQLGLPGCNGHHHTHLVKQHYSVQCGASEWHQLGCGHVRSAKFCNAAKWSNGILLIHVDTWAKRSVFEYVDIRDFAILGGQFYYRSPTPGSDDCND
jgi:predicted phosphodiesterase